MVSDQIIGAMDPKEKETACIYSPPVRQSCVCKNQLDGYAIDTQEPDQLIINIPGRVDFEVIIFLGVLYWCTWYCTAAACRLRVSSPAFRS
jgi:hypothetical protein